MADWRHEQGYKIPEMCLSCAHCAVNYIAHDLTDYYCTREYVGHPPMQLQRCTSDERDEFIKKYGHSHEVHPNATCRYWKVRQ